MRFDAWKTALKWLWLVTIVVFAIYYGWPRRDNLSQAIETLGWTPITFAFFLIIGAKLCLVANMQMASSRFGIRLFWWDGFCIYNQTQLAKYVPGSIWQFVGRIAILRSRGYDGRTIRDALMAEHFWVLLVAGVLALLSMLTHPEAYAPLLLGAQSVVDRWLDVGSNEALLLVLMVVALSALAIVRWIDTLRSLLRWLVELLPSWQAIVPLLLAWSLFGASLWVTIEPFMQTAPPFVFTVGLYCLAYAIGFLVPFAPAGLGVREVVLVIGMSMFLDDDIAFLLAGVNRLVYFSVEAALVLVSFFIELIKGSKNTKDYK